jgi:hypothetical protein
MSARTPTVGDDQSFMASMGAEMFLIVRDIHLRRRGYLPPSIT